MPWPVRDLFEEDINAAPLLSPFSSGSGVDNFLSLIDTPSTYTGQAGLAVQVNAGETGLEFASAGGGFDPDKTFIVDPGGSITSFDGTAYTDIQTALDAANALTPSSSNQYVVWIVPGVYDEGSLTLYSYVHIMGMGTGPDFDSSTPMPVSIGLGEAASGTPCISSVDNCVISNIFFYLNGQTGHTEFISVDHAAMTFNDCAFANSSSADPFDINEGRFNRCLFDNVLADISGGAEFNDCRFIADVNPTKPITISGEAYWNNCTFFSNGAYNGTDGLRVTSPLFKMTGGSIECIGGQHIEVEGDFTGVTFDLTQQASLASQVISTMEVTGGASFTGCKMLLEQTTTGNTSTVGFIRIGDLTGGDIMFSGCYIETNGDNAMFMLHSTISDENDNRIIFSGNTLKAHDTSSALGHIFDVHSSGFSGHVIIELNGNYYFHDSFNTYPTMPTNAGSGILKWRGSDIKAIFHPVDPSLSTAIVNVDNYPAAEVDVAAEVAYVTGRNPVPGGVLVDASLVLSAENSNGIDTDAMTDSDGTNLSAHTPTGGSGTWTATAGTITIQSNRASCSTTGTNIYTYSIGASNGFLSADVSMGSGSSTHYMGLLFRYADASNYWRLTASDDSPRMQLVKRVAASETTIFTDTTFTNDLAVSFVGNIIRVWEGYGTANQRLRAEVEDSDLAANTTVGIICIRNFAGTHTLDDWAWHPGGDVDITVETGQAQYMEPFNASPDSSDDNGVDVLHRAYSYHDIAVGVGEDLWNCKVTLDVLNGDITDLRVHGIITRHLPVNNTDHYSASEFGYPSIGMITR